MNTTVAQAPAAQTRARCGGQANKLLSGKEVEVFVLKSGSEKDLSVNRLWGWLRSNPAVQGSIVARASISGEPPPRQNIVFGWGTRRSMKRGG
ncbi:MAG: hypothetical protein ACTS5I_07830, partial [Rhodanobacter sp.]